MALRLSDAWRAEKSGFRPGLFSAVPTGLNLEPPVLTQGLKPEPFKLLLKSCPDTGQNTTPKMFSFEIRVFPRPVVAGVVTIESH
jgi:hypothetical protein